MSALRDGAVEAGDGLPTLADVRRWLADIADPEIPVVSIAELGILRDVRWAGASGHAASAVEVVITPTYSGCPAIGQIEDDIRSLLAAHGVAARVTTQLAPAWTTDWLSDATGEKLRQYGIAPPGAVRLSGSGVEFVPITFAPKNIAECRNPIGPAGQFDLESQVACPRCGSLNTTETSHFGSTACKSMYRCLSCMEPFDHFKRF